MGCHLAKLLASSVDIVHEHFMNGYISQQLEVSSKAMFSYVGCVNLEIAVTQGEIINPNAIMTRDRAIEVLKEAKDLFDLDMMSQDEYDAIRAEVTPIIKG